MIYFPKEKSNAGGGGKREGLNGKVKMIASKTIWGSMGLVVRWIGLPTAAVALARGALGAVFLFLVLTLTGRRVAWRAVRDNLGRLILSGALLGANWIFLFEAYRRTTVQLATLSYYLAPVLILAASPLVLKERLTARKAACVLAALGGMALVSKAGSGGAGNLAGILFGLSAAVCYAGLTLVNKFLKGVYPMEATMVQLAVSALALLPYALVSGALTQRGAGLTDALLLIVLGVVHTGLAFFWFFSSVRELKAQTVAMFSYIDPATAILLSAVLLRERLDAPQILGACLILGAALFGELPFPRPTRTRAA
jgi:RarD protein